MTGFLIMIGVAVYVAGVGMGALICGLASSSGDMDLLREAYEAGYRDGARSRRKEAGE